MQVASGSEYHCSEKLPDKKNHQRHLLKIQISGLRTRHVESESPGKGPENVFFFFFNQGPGDSREFWEKALKTSTFYFVFQSVFKNKTFIISNIFSCILKK